MKTKVWRVDPNIPDPRLLAEAAQAILEGKLVAFPTETVYGLGANALDRQAVQRVFVAKGRPAQDPLIVHLASAELLSQVARDIPPLAERLVKQFWPGPLTLVLWKQPHVLDEITAGLPTVAVRVPAHPVALGLLQVSGVPIVAPSANRFGHVSPTTAQHVLEDLEGLIEGILDAGPTPVGVESTVLDVTGSPPQVLRPGGISLEALQSLIGPVVYSARFAEAGDQLAPQRSPGLLAKHYAPRAELWLFLGGKEQALGKMRETAERLSSTGRRLGLLVSEEDRGLFSDLPLVVYSLGSERQLDKVAQRLYAGLRSLDRRGVELIFAREMATEGLGWAICDRLRRAASRVVE
ncbi:MAG: L-threonylcarbamoyladenylate synthase [Anaerolineales bacterium]|nr:L-threonylcarbamoyladenylate synthase [Anaerolineales bacterium]MCS7247423.1 L-threonylcarbamoyladenylate synthase [Anaerolineales bacterium]MDW8161234.1 L-threonylcarbamoyladenylate synthase [Anaerolineales bacterium]MDW8447347.1 L-threonylcarbamoyladenylate synthase [Anaerolineales bacterium]